MLVNLRGQVPTPQRLYVREAASIMTNTPNEQPAANEEPTTPKHSTYDEIPSPVSASDHKDFAYVGESDQHPSKREESLLHKITEVGEDAAKKLKEIFSDIDREEVKRSINRDNIQRSVASAFDSLNSKVQELLAPKGERHSSEKRDADKKDGTDHAVPRDPFSGQSSSTSPSSTDAPSGPGPVGTEAVQPETTEDPFLRNPEDRTDTSRGF